jgi:hypothetical protein
MSVHRHRYALRVLVRAHPQFPLHPSAARSEVRDRVHRASVCRHSRFRDTISIAALILETIGLVQVRVAAAASQGLSSIQHYYR